MYDGLIAENEQQRKSLDSYFARGYGKNERGEYYNPFSGKYEANFDPREYLQLPDFDMTFDGEGEFLDDDIGLLNIDSGGINIGNINIGNTSTNDDTEIEEDNYTSRKLSAALTTGLKYTAIGGLKVGSLLAKGTAAATVGTIGVAAGLASDDYSNVFKYGAAGLAGGAIIGNSAVNRVKKLPSDAYRIKKSVTDIRDDYEQRLPADEQKRRRNERADDAFMRDKEVIKLYKSKFGDNYKQAMNDAKQYREYGITDNETIIKAMNLKTSGLGYRTDKKRILIAKHAQDLGRKDIDSFGERLKNKGIDDKVVESIKEGVRAFKDIE